MPTLREIMLLQELQHENVIELIEVFVHNCNINLVFEFCSADLEHIVKTKTLPLDGPRIKGYMLGTLRGLAHLPLELGAPPRPQAGQPSHFTSWRRQDRRLWPRARFRQPGPQVHRAGGDALVPRSRAAFRRQILRFGRRHVVGRLHLLRTPSPCAVLSGSSDIDQLARIFTALGTPDDAVWPGLSSLPDYIPFQPVPGTPLREIFVGADDVALDLLSKLLTLCPGERLGADEALRHPYFVKT